MEILLLSFCNKFFPGTSEKYSATFTSKQIQHLVHSHSGNYIPLEDINTYLQENGYDYELLDNEFTWLCLEK
jgi:hypothetical protein